MVHLVDTRESSEADGPVRRENALEQFMLRGDPGRPDAGSDEQPAGTVLSSESERIPPYDRYVYG